MIYKNSDFKMQKKYICKKALKYFLKNIKNNLKIKFLDEVELKKLKDLPINKYKLNQLKSNTQSLIVIGNLNDLNDKAVIGLIAHLYGLIFIGYNKNTKLNGKKWLKVDLYSDEIAKSWGFKKEIEELRKIRPQNMPIKLNYNIPILEHSVPDLKFKKDIDNVLKKNLINKFTTKNRILYTGKFSLICNIELLRKCSINNLFIITNSYTQNKKILQSLLTDI